MPRSDPSKWAKDTTRMQVARLVDDQGRGKGLVRANARYNPARDDNTRVRSLFAQAGDIPVYSQALHGGHTLQCANPDCHAPLHFVGRAGREGDRDKNNGHFRCRRVGDHASLCMFRNPARDYEPVLSLQDAIAQGKPIIVNINDLPCGFHSKAPVHFDHRTGKNLTGYEEWQQSVGSEGYHRISVHSLAELMAARERVIRRGGEEALDLMWFNNNTMPVPYGTFWKADVSDRTQANGLQDSGEFYRELLSQFLVRLQDRSMAHARTVQLATRLVTFDAQQGSRTQSYDPKERRLLGHPTDLGHSRAFVQPSLEFVGLQHHSQSLARNIVMEDLVARQGSRFYVLASPTLHLPSGIFAREDMVRAIRNAVNGHGSAVDPIRLNISWVIDEDYAKQLIAKPRLRPEPRADFFSALPFTEEERAQTPRVVLAPKAPHKPKQLALDLRGGKGRKIAAAQHPADIRRGPRV